MMGQITKDFAELMVKAAEAGHHTPLTAWEQKQFALAWLERESLRTAGVQGDAARLDWIEQKIQSKGSVWLLPCGESLRFVQVRHAGHCENYPTVEGLRAAIDAAIAQSTKGA
jgi:hypothetical protein